MVVDRSGDRVKGAEGEEVVGGRMVPADGVVEEREEGEEVEEKEEWGSAEAEDRASVMSG